MKCGEEKPQCARCLKSGQACIYGTRDPKVTPRTESRDLLSSAPTTGDKVISQRQHSSEPTLQYSPLGSERGVRIPASTILPNSRDPNSQNDLNYIMPRSLTSGNTDEPVFSPVGVRAYATTPISVPTSDGLVTMSTSSQPTFNAAISRWFDILVGDCTLYNQNSDFDVDVEDLNSFDAPRHQDRNVMPSLRSISDADETTTRQPTSPVSSSPQLLERTAADIDQNSAAEKLRWQSPSTIELLPHEHKTFQNFVRRTSRWVHLVCPMRNYLAYTTILQIDLFDPSQSFSTFVPHLAVRFGCPLACPQKI